MEKASGFLDYIENNKISQSVRTGLMMTIPVLMVGSIALILISLPILAYQNFMKTFAGASSLLWFFGIHGSDVLESVSHTMFSNGDSIFTKHFLESFVLIGGCGSTMSLLIAILLFSKSRTSRKLSTIASVPMLFHINELMVFGLPIVLNPIFFLPFVLTPMVCTLLSYFVISVGWVPVAIHEVEWTTPVFLSLKKTGFR